MSSMPFRHVCVLGLSCALALPGLAMAKTPGTYLTWQNKAAQPVNAPVDIREAPPATVSSGGRSYPVPPSPYGQVGDPFARNLNWPSKQGGQQPTQVASVQPLTRQPAPISVPVAPRPIEPRVPNVSVSAPVPLAAPRPVSVPKQAVAPRPAPQPAPTASSAPTETTADGGYQVPATSKYAAQIAAARARQAHEQAKDQAAATPDAQKAAPKTAGTVATVPAPTSQLASEETDHVFIPGEQYKNAADGPRLYSLHRAYGLTPDPITVDHNATGAVLGSADLHADEGEDDDAPADKASTDTSPASSESASKAKP